MSEFHGSAKIKNESYSVTSEDIVKDMLTIYHSKAIDKLQYSPKPDEFVPEEGNL